ncbi:hypothetical protein [Bordetella phage vB_BbrM_PHB04]|uniref:Uncharacterized protein n=1 Tax=Bordetella phage vB_BbrM_PHB04 TaxID=2029657 RepID=A0A291LAN4_9CAUD|nr:hypothetical protein HOS14_gp058 [Bordetella phage vB_BbrM_PHB04]ATI15676.1 hypothetical protein [Bordetella phage vB_BbrM_PHB04]
MEWFDHLVWVGLGALSGELIWQVRCWIRAKATRELTHAMAELHGMGRYQEADKVKLPKN